jgi:hypothetical protein
MEFVFARVLAMILSCSRSEQDRNAFSSELKNHMKFFNPNNIWKKQVLTKKTTLADGRFYTSRFNGIYTKGRRNGEGCASGNGIDQH